MKVQITIRNLTCYIVSRAPPPRTAVLKFERNFRICYARANQLILIKSSDYFNEDWEINVLQLKCFADVSCVNFKNLIGTI